MVMIANRILNKKKSPLLSKDFCVEVRGIEPLTF